MLRRRKSFKSSISLKHKQCYVNCEKRFEVRDKIIRRIGVKTQKTVPIKEKKLEEILKNQKFDISKEYSNVEEAQ